MSGRNRKDNNFAFRILLFITPMVFYLFFWLYDGVIWCVDSDSYVIMHECREPLYPCLLAFIKNLVNDANHSNSNYYLNIVVLIQSILAAVSVWSLSDFLYRKCRLGKICAFAVMAIPLVVSLMNRFVASRASMYSNSILTEGIAISIYMLFFRHCLEYICSGNKRQYFFCIILSIIGILTRKQMYVLLLLLLVATVYVRMTTDCQKGRTNRFVQMLIELVMACAAVLMAVFIIDNVYNRAFHGEYRTHTEDNRFVSTMAFYTAEREYAEYISGEYREVFLEIYDICDSNKWLYKYAPSDWYGATSHFGDNYDHIQLDTMELILTEHQNDWSIDRQNYTEKLDVVRNEFNKALIPHELKSLSRVIFNNILEGIVNTVAQKRKVLCVYTVIIIICYLAMMILLRLLYLRKSRGLAENPEIKNVCEFALFSFFAVLLNVCVVATVIFPQTRYTIYNMPIFYMMLLIMSEKLLKGVRRKAN